MKDQSGASLLLALGTSAALLVVTFFMSDQLLLMRKQVQVNAEAPQKRLVLHSSLDYVIFAIKQKWCFNDAMLPDRICDLNHPRSMERLLISPEQEMFLKDLEAKNLLPSPLPAEGVRLSKLEMSVPVTSMNANHPLFKIIQNVIAAEMDPDQKVTGLEFLIEKETNVALPQSGREVYLNLSVKLKTTEGFLKFGSSPVEARALVSVHPREIGSFALVIARNLYLNGQTVSEPGDVSFPVFPSSDAVGASLGLQFDSPVFVNRDIHLPEGTGKKGEKYSPVTFADRVYLGDGRIYQNGLPFVPSSAGGFKSSYWSDHKQIGGFQKGIENDGARDGGLDYLANPAGAAPVDTSLMEKCITRNLTRADPTYIEESELVSKVLNSSSTSSSSKALFQMGFSDGNEFSEQENDLENIQRDPWAGSFQRDIRDWAHRKPVIEVEVTIGSQKIVGQMSRDTDFNLDFNLGAQEGYEAARAAVRSTRDRIENLKNQQASYNARRLDLVSDLNDAQTEVVEFESKVAQVEAKLAQEESDLAALEAQTSPSASNGDLKRAEDDVKDAESDLKDAKDDLEKAKDDLAKTQADLANFDAKNPNNFSARIVAEEALLGQQRALRDRLKVAVDYPPRLELDTEPVDSNKPNRIRKNLLDLSLEIKNQNSFIDRNGNYVAPVVKIQAYDATFFRSDPIENDPTKQNSNLVREFKFSTSGGIVSLPSGLSSPTSTTVSTTPIAVTEDLGELDALCDTAAVATSSSAFGGASWDYSFAPNTRHSWNFAGTSGTANPAPAPLVPEIIFDATNALPSNVTFQVRSIVGICRIAAGARIVTGFLTCDRLIIEERTAPLRIIGSIIAVSVDINQKAFQAGIRWSTIYHPQATQELRAMSVLKSYSPRGCAANATPFWHPIPSIADVADRFNCNSVFLRAKANPFQWTAVDPDCGYVTGNPTQTCKNRLIRFFVVEHNREAGI